MLCLSSCTVASCIAGWTLQAGRPAEACDPVENISSVENVSSVENASSVDNVSSVENASSVMDSRSTLLPTCPPSVCQASVQLSIVTAATSSLATACFTHNVSSFICRPKKKGFFAMVGCKMLFKKASPLDNPSTKHQVRHLSLYCQALLSLLPMPHCAVLCALKLYQSCGAHPRCLCQVYLLLKDFPPVWPQTYAILHTIMLTQYMLCYASHHNLWTQLNLKCRL